MQNEEEHPLFSKDIIWLSPQDLDRIRGSVIDRRQLEREENYERQKPSNLLRNKTCKENP